MRLRRRSPLPLPQDPDCHAVGAVLQAFLDGELGPEDAELVAGHLELCEYCEIEKDTVQRVIDAIRRQRPDLDPGPIDRLAGFASRIAEHDPPQQPRR